MSGFTDDGEQVPDHLINSVFQKYSSILEQCNFYKRVCNGENVEERSFGQYLENEINKYISTKDEKDRPLLKAMFNQMVTREVSINGANSLDDISLKNYGLYTEIEGGNLIIHKGFGLIVKGLIDDVINKTKKMNKPDQFNLLLNHVVTKIKWQDIESKDKWSVEVVCENGKSFQCNHLVNTMPIGVLKDKMETLFEPNLPKSKIDSINAMNFDHINKVYLEYDEPLSPKFIDSSVKNQSEIMVFFRSDETEQNEIKKQTNLEKYWIRKVYSFSKINNRLILAWLSGKEAAYAAQLDQEIVGKQFTKLLRSMFKNEFPLPSKVTMTRWGFDKFTLGSYSNLKVGSSGKNIANLSQPIFNSANKPVLLFAGEATHPIYFSTTHGAFLSGKNAANYLTNQ